MNNIILYYVNSSFNYLKRRHLCRGFSPFHCDAHQYVEEILMGVSSNIILILKKKTSLIIIKYPQTNK